MLGFDTAVQLLAAWVGEEEEDEGLRREDPGTPLLVVEQPEISFHVQYAYLSPLSAETWKV